MIDPNDYDYDYDDIDTLIEAGVVYADFREDLRREQAGRD